MPSPTALTLVIANKNYSSWSARAWITMTALKIPFTERVVKLDSTDWDRNIATLSPSRLVPVLWEGSPGSGFATFDTIAILERLHELFPGAGVWPSEPQARARARALVADFHAGYQTFRSAMPMNIRSRYPGKGRQVAPGGRPCRRGQRPRSLKRNSSRWTSPTRRREINRRLRRFSPAAAAGLRTATPSPPSPH